MRGVSLLHLKNSFFNELLLSGLCQCFHPWIGDDCSVNSTVPPELDQVGDGEPCDAVCSECLSVRLYGENFVDVENLTCHYKVLNVGIIWNRLNQAFQNFVYA